MGDLAFKAMSVEEYLRTEESSPVKREYVGGFVYPLHGATLSQAGTSKVHMRLSLNFVCALDTAALRSECRLHRAGMRLKIVSRSSFSYPDIMVVCGPDNGEAYLETEPCLLVEVLSKGTARGGSTLTSAAPIRGATSCGSSARSRAAAASLCRAWTSR
ncbi:hypothetical protein GCM10022631_40610 [Deinococcus rubellus]|uniref:Uma2 family endonuclease n=1 Tax=Deinococcus rubellus TaxID=1889240 RepID=A0ABY5YFY3_9DEIO|nr:Uma2 family endonuclease [Deinococcus rubellus]UWX63851.1 Uma2 family endonuclease [Deinococcus rubellus]